MFILLLSSPVKPFSGGLILIILSSSKLLLFNENRRFKLLLLMYFILFSSLFHARRGKEKTIYVETLDREEKELKEEDELALVGEKSL